jgi:hypothetical protein
MKAQILKIAGVKSEKEFYKKFPTEAAFMKKHGKELAKLKKAAVGDVIEYTDVEAGNNRKVIDGSELLKSVNKDTLDYFDQFKDRAYELGVDALTTEEEKEDYEYKAKIDAMYANMNKKDDGLLGKIQGLGGALEGLSGLFGGGEGGPTGSVEVGDAEIIGMVAGKKGAKISKDKLKKIEGELYKASNMHKSQAERIGKMLKKGGKVEKFEPHMMYDPKTKKGKKAMTYKEHLALKKKGWGHEAPKAQTGLGQIQSMDLGFEIPQQDQYGNPDGSGMFGKAFSKGQYNEDGTAMNFGQRVGSFLQSDELGQVLNSPITKDIMMGISKIKGQKDALKDLKQMKEVSGIALQAAMTKPEEIERDYVRPEDIQNTGEEFFPIYGVGTNVLAKRGGNFLNNFRAGGPRNLNLKGDDLLGKGEFTYGLPYYETMKEKLEHNRMLNRRNVNSMRALQDGGYVPLNNPSIVKSYQDGGGVPYDAIGNTLGNFAYGDKASRDAGSNIGGGVGRGIGTLVGGPLGGAIGDFIGSGIGDVLDRNDRRQRHEREQIDRNISTMNNMKIGPQIHAGYASHMQKGGSVAGDGNVKTLWGGDVNAVSYNPYAGGESLYFSGNSHDKKDPKTGQTGIGVAYGPQSVANNEAVVEVENEPAQIMQDGGNQENLVVFGDLKIPNNFISELGDDNAKGKKFKNYVNNLNDEEARINKQMGKAVENAGDTQKTKWGELVRSTSDAIVQGGDMKLKDIANKKEMLADLQTALNDTFNERGIDGNKFLSKGEIEAVKDTQDYAEDGAEIPIAQGGLKTNKLPTKFKTIKEAEDADFVWDEEQEKWKKEKTPAKEKVDRKDATGSDIGDMPEGQKYDDRTGLAGNVTEADYEEFVKENSWFDWENFDRRKPADVKRFQREFNKRNKDAGIDVSVNVDGVIGEETSSARFTPEMEAVEATPAEYEYAQVEEEATTTETTTVKPRTPFDASFLRPLFRRPIDNDLDYNQILPEINAAANNQLDPVYAQTYQPRLRVPYDISLQDRRNQLTSQYRAMSQNPAVQNNPALAAAMAAPMYDAINNTTAEEFRLNQAMKDNVYSGNINAINQARLTNLGIYDQQQQRQAQAVANTKATQQEIVKSIADKYQQNKLENRREKVLRELYPNFRFTEDLDLFNQGNAQFNLPGGQTSAFGPYQTIFDYLTGGGFGGGQNTNSIGDGIDKKEMGKTLDNIKSEAIYDYVNPPGQYGKYGTNLKPINRKVKKNHRNSNILRQFKKQ